MINAIRSATKYPIRRSFSSSHVPVAPVLDKRTCSFRFKGLASLSSQQESAHVMDKAENPETGDGMYHSFGHEYATRCEDEGFGVVHSTKQSETDDARESRPGSDVEKKQETPAKEEEGRHRTNK